MAARLSTSLIKQLTDDAMDAAKKLLTPSSTEETIDILTQVENILYMVQQSKSRSTAKALDPVVEALIAKEVLNHADIDVNISVACCICDVLTITTPYNHQQMKDFFELVVVTFEKLTSTRGGCYTKMMKVLETLSSVKFMELMSECLHLDGLIVRLFKQFLNASESNSSAVVSKMEKILTMILGESKAFPHELVKLLVTSVKKDNQIDAPVCSQLGGKVLKNCAARLSKPHLFDMSIRPCQDSQIENEHEKIKPSSIDPPMPSKSVQNWNGKRKRNKKQAQSVEYGENLVGKRIKVWWPADKKYYEGVVESFDCTKKKHKVLYDDGEQERLKLNLERWEFVENVVVASPETGTTCVQGYKVKNINAPILESIFKKHGDIVANCAFITSAARESVLEVVCEVVRKIQNNDYTSTEELLSQVSAAEAIKVNVSWLRAHLEAKKKCSLLMKMTANASLVTIAAEMDLKEARSKLTTAQERFEKAEKCVEVLNLVKKKLNDSFLESKAEKDYWVEEQPIL